MALESASWITQLVATNPVVGDPVGEGDDHLRMIKTVLQNSFPSSSTSAIIPNMSGQSGKYLTTDGTDASWALVEGVPAGVITMWSGSVATIPSGWAICDGNNGTPNLTGRFVIHADADTAGTYNVGDTGGSTTTGAHTLTTAEIPSHTHSVDPPSTSTNNNTHNHSSSANSVGGDLVTVGSGGANGADNGNVTGSNTHSHNVNIAAFNSAATGGGGSHSHTNTIPPYYALAYIMKT